MADVVECPQCHRQLRLPDGLLGQVAKCPACAMTFVIGEEPPPSAAPEPAAVPPPVEAPAPRRQFDDDDAPPVRRARRDMTPHRGGVILTFGILSLVCGCMGIIFGPAAWTMANADMAEIHAGRMDPEGESLTQAGRICGIIGTAISVITVCCAGLPVAMEILSR
jgi:hypothetical protein